MEMTVRKSPPSSIVKIRRVSSRGPWRGERYLSLLLRWAGMEVKTSSCLSSSCMTLTIWIRQFGRMADGEGALSWQEVRVAFVLLFTPI